MQGPSETSASGARIELWLESQNPERVAYRLSLKAGPTAWSGQATLSLDTGSVELTGFETDPEPPDWVLASTRALLRSIWRARVADPTWPRRVRRWRAPPGPKPGSY
jgi:hypothetical protein